MFTWKIITKLIYQAFILFTAISNLSKVGSQIPMLNLVTLHPPSQNTDLFEHPL